MKPGNRNRKKYKDENVGVKGHVLTRPNPNLSVRTFCQQRYEPVAGRSGAIHQTESNSGQKLRPLATARYAVVKTKDQSCLPKFGFARLSLVPVAVPVELPHIIRVAVRYKLVEGERFRVSPTQRCHERIMHFSSRYGPAFEFEVSRSACVMDENAFQA
jgi:hypothetical protein